MKLQRIPKGHHVVRYCKRRLAIRDQGRVVGVFPEFFCLRESVPPMGGAETFLSAVYYEYFEGDHSRRMSQCARAMPFAVPKGSALVQIDAEAVRAEGKAQRITLRVSHEADNKSVPSKARIDGIPVPAKERLASALCERTIVDIAEILA